jgi:hypothetical protein
MNTANDSPGEQPMTAKATYHHHLQAAQDSLRFAWLYVSPITPPKDARDLDLCVGVTMNRIDMAIAELEAAKAHVRGALLANGVAKAAPAMGVA